MKKVQYSLVAIMMLALQGCGGSDSSSDTPERPPVIGFSGTIDGLAGQVTIDVNGQEQTIEQNGTFVLDATVEVGTDFNIQVVDAPAGLECTLNTSSGVASNDITDLQINCEGIDTKAYSISALNFNDETDTSVIATTLHLIDRKNDRVVDTLNTENVTEYLSLLENGLPVSKQESFVEVDPVSSLSSSYTTVIAVDISSSIQNSLEPIKAAIKDIIVDENGESKLLPKQQVAIVTFDADVVFETEPTQDLNTLIAAIDSIEVGGPSTNLFGAIEASVNRWTNQISIQQMSYGSLILFTDGNDSSALVSKEDALSAAADKDIYFITIGDETDQSVLEEFTSTKNILNLDNIDDVADSLYAAIDKAQTYENGLYVISYATPKRAGEHTLTIEANDDYNCETAASAKEQTELENSGELANCTDSVEFEFNANGYSDVETRLDIYGIERTVVKTVEWTAKTRYSNQAPKFEWRTQLCLGDVTTTVNKNTITFTREVNQLSVVKVDVTDVAANVKKTKYIYMSDDEREVDGSSSQACNN